jgi:hypothetical protein
VLDRHVRILYEFMFLYITPEGVHKQVFKKANHIAFVSQPDGKYVTHLTPPRKTGLATAEAIMDFVTPHGLEKSWKVLGGDSTNTNTG